MVLSDRCGLAAWIHWSCIGEIVLGFKSVEELYPSPPLEVYSADTNQLPKEKEFEWKIPIIPNNPARQKYRYTSVPIEATSMGRRWRGELKKSEHFLSSHCSLSFLMRQ